jgi:hypothetical protein
MQNFGSSFPVPNKIASFIDPSLINKHDHFAKSTIG